MYVIAITNNIDAPNYARVDEITTQQIQTLDPSGQTDGWESFLDLMVRQGFELIDWNQYVENPIYVFSQAA